MERNKAPASVQVKQVIADLCRLLAATGLQAVPAPETFRRAKFCGGPEVEGEFWQLLTSILQTAGSVSCETCGQPEERKKLVAAGLWQSGFYGDWMFMRTEGGEEEEPGRCSSRELLLALGWLIAAGTLEKLVTERVQRLDKTLFTSIPVHTQFSNELQIEAASLRKLQWLIGSLRHQGRMLLSMQEEQTRLLHTLLNASVSSSVSPSEQSLALLQEDCAHLRLLCELLESYLNWKQVENVFWTWMDSVMDCHLTDPVAERPAHSPRGRSKVCCHGNQGLEKLEEMLTRIQAGQKEQSRDRGHVEERGERLQAPSDASPPSLPSFPQVYQARLQTERPVKHSRRAAELLHGGAEAPHELQASQATKLLRQTEALLLERRDRRRLANRLQLQELVSRQEELVLIPP